jgi:hypothetical protein
MDVGRDENADDTRIFHSPGLVKALRAGQSIIVTDKVKPALTVTKLDERSCITRADLAREAAEICPGVQPKVNFATALPEELSKSRVFGGDSGLRFSRSDRTNFV